MKSWKDNFLTPKKEMRLFKVGPHNMMLGDLVKLGYKPEDFKEVLDPWAKKSNYNVDEIARTMAETLVKAQQNIMAKKE